MIEKNILFVCRCRQMSINLQDDVVMGTLTVRENLAFSARLRLPPSVSANQRQQRVDQVMQELGLQDVADSKVEHAHTHCRFFYVCLIE